MAETVAMDDAPSTPRMRSSSPDAVVVAFPSVAATNGAERDVAPTGTDAAGFVGVDRAFFVARRNGLVAVAAALWVAIATMVGAHVAIAPLGLSVEASAFAALGGGVAVYAFFAAVIGLLMSQMLERKLNEINRIARIGCERLRVDDGALVRSAIRDVLREWMHINFFADRFRWTGAYAVFGLAVQAVGTLGAIAVFALALQPDGWALVPLVAGPAALTIVHFASLTSALRRQARAMRPGADDPTEALADRMVALLEEVKDLRKPRRVE